MKFFVAFPRMLSRKEVTVSFEYDTSKNGNVVVGSIHNGISKKKNIKVDKEEMLKLNSLKFHALCEDKLVNELLKK